MKRAQNQTIIILSPPGLKEGFLLSGATVISFNGDKEFSRQLKVAALDEDVAIIAIPNYMEEKIPNRVAKKIKERATLMLAAYPVSKQFREWEIDRAIDRPVEQIGFHVEIDI